MRREIEFSRNRVDSWVAGLSVLKSGKSGKSRANRDELSWSPSREEKEGRRKEKGETEGGREGGRREGWKEEKRKEGKK